MNYSMFRLHSLIFFGSKVSLHKWFLLLAFRHLISEWENAGVLCDCKRSVPCPKWKNVSYGWKVILPLKYILLNMVLCTILVLVRYECCLKVMLFSWTNKIDLEIVYHHRRSVSVMDVLNIAIFLFCHYAIKYQGAMC